MKKKGKRVPRKEEIAEDWCFICKDGGMLLVCEYKQCLKSYHAECVGKDDSFVETETKWTCGLHFCYVCGRASDVECYCCPTAVCSLCIKNADFVHVRGKNGFCNHCLKLSLLIEEKKDVDSDGEEVDFNDRETYEGLFREYWEIINTTEKLTLEELISANARIKTGKNHKSDSDSDKYDNIEENQEVSDYDGIDDEEPPMPGLKRKRDKRQHPSKKRKVKHVKAEYTGWGSKSLMQFLTSIGKDPSRELSQREVSNIIHGYIKEKKLIDPQRSRIVLCDASLQSVFARKTVNKHRIFDLLESHFAENQGQSEEDELGFNSEDDDNNVHDLETHKRKRKLNPVRVKEMPCDVPRSNYASIIPENIKLVYLKRSLVQKLLEQPEVFERKVVGSFVRVKSDPNDFFRKNSYQLVEVTGIRKSLVGESNQEIFLQIDDTHKDIGISLLSDDDFSEEECQELKSKIKAGLHKKLRVDVLEQKAMSLHEDIIKHWIPRELAVLQNLIDRANEKGWRRELFQYLEKRQFLQNPIEQSRLLKKVPTVVPDVEETGIKDMEDNKICNERSPKSILMGASGIPSGNWKANGPSSGEKRHDGHVFVEEEMIKSETSATKAALSKSSHVLAGQVSVKEEMIKSETSATKSAPSKSSHVLVGHVSVKEEMIKSETSARKGEPSKRSHVLAPQFHVKAMTLEELKEKHFEECSKDCVALAKKEQIKDEQGGPVKSDDDGNSNDIHKNKPEVVDTESSEWNVIGLYGEREGPCSLSLLKKWSDNNPIAFKSKVWKSSESEEHAIPLTDVLNHAFPKIIQ